MSFGVVGFVRCVWFGKSCLVFGLTCLFCCVCCCLLVVASVVVVRSSLFVAGRCLSSFANG